MIDRDSSTSLANQRYPRKVITREAARAYVKGWVETGRLLEEQRWRDLASLAPQHALDMSDALIEAALRVPIPAARQTWSGLVELQDLLHQRRS